MLSLAPLQGFTDYVFRQSFAKHFPGVDAYYTPFIRFERDKEIKNSKLKDILPENNIGLNIIPQMLTNTVEQFNYLAKMFSDYGYQEINWNLGCPYPMVSKHKLGSGLLPYPDLIDSILDAAFSKTNLKLSIKMRTGYQSHDEIFSILPILNKYPITEIIIHPRIGTQIYKGTPNIDIFEQCIKSTNHKIAYNGDIDSVETYQNLKARFPQIEHWMIGRALISNPFLANDIKGIPVIEDKMKIFSDFHDTLFQQYASNLSGDTHLLNKMIFFWEYFSFLFSNPHKAFKRIKKSTSLEKYHSAVRENLNNW